MAFLLEWYMKTCLSLKMIIPIVLASLLFACSDVKNNSLSDVKTGNLLKNQTQDSAWQQVTVAYYSFEGGFYGLTTTDGIKLLPVNLANEYQVAGSIIKVKGQLIKDAMTIQQWGTPFEIEDVELVHLGTDN